MYTAMPLQGTSLASHFTKASSFAIFDQQGVMVKQFINPASESGCDKKSQLLELLKSHQVSLVVVKNIGERMLGKLLDSKMSVKQANLRGTDMAAIWGQLSGFPELTEMSQGRESVNYHKKQEQGGCCSHEHNREHGKSGKHSCCSANHARHQHGKGQCCKR